PIAHLMVRLHAAIERFGEARIELGRGDDQPGVERGEEHARRRRNCGAVDLIEHAVAEHTVVVEIVGNGQIERLVEMGEPFRWTREYRRREDGKHESAEDDPGNGGIEFQHAVPNYDRHPEVPGRRPGLEGWTATEWPPPFEAPPALASLGRGRTSR